jgi:glucose/arabinose dehydrogenase
MRRAASALLSVLVVGLPACRASAPEATPAGSSAARRASKLPIELLRMPAGFHVEVFAEDLPDARSLARGDRGTIFVGTREGDTVRALVDRDGDFHADEVHVVARGLDTPNGVAFRGGALYVAEISRILRLDAIEDHLDDPPKPVVVNADYPRDKWHGWKFIAFSPDGRLHVPVGAPCNACEREDPYAGITSLAADGSDRRQVARGVRNTVGFDWHPVTKELWFTDNGRDMLGDELPNDELNRAPKEGLHFGFPYCHQGDVLDPEFGKGHSCDTYVPPARKLGPHVAALGMRFYRGTMFPPKYRNAILIAEHGSWNRSTKIGYRVVAVFLDEAGTATTGEEVLVEGFLQGEKAWGRPVDVLELPDGSVLISDDFAGAIYRLTWRP